MWTKKLGLIPAPVVTRESMSKCILLPLIFVTNATFLLYVWSEYHLVKYWHQAMVEPVANGSTFDFIVVGSGTAGSVVVRRLAEQGHSVLLLEAGGPASWLMGIPAVAWSFMGSPYDWK